jgi:pentatricopeptide repeat protein
MKVERIETTSFIYHSAISACGKADKYEEAVQLLEEMKQRKVERTCVTYSLMIGACKKGGRWEEALRFLSDMENDNNAGVRVDTDEGVSQPGGFLIANTLVYGAVISVCVDSQQWGLALELLERMEVLGVQRNVVTYNTVIEALSNAGITYTYICSPPLYPVLLTFIIDLHNFLSITFTSCALACIISC